MLSPESVEAREAASKDIAFRSSDVGYTLREHGARKITLTISRVLPKVPIIPWCRVARFGVIVRDPQPAISEGLSLSRAHIAAVQDGAEAILTAIDTGKLSGPLPNPFDKPDGLIDAHRAAGIMIVLLKIEHQQDSAPT